MATATAKKTKVKPIDDRVVIQPTEAKNQTDSGIILPESAKEKPMHGKVVAVGPGKVNDEGERNELQVKKGDLVVYGKYAGTEVEVDGEDHVILRESELLAILDK